MKRLERLLAARGLCANGYRIASRDPMLAPGKSYDEEYAAVEITYLGQCL
jgi:hypothetical protein